MAGKKKPKLEIDFGALGEMLKEMEARVKSGGGSRIFIAPVVKRVSKKKKAT